ncbi:MAG: FAD-dependent oxidoreductase [Clostridiaceae bacterium]|nr:FAD-dependent oxidoreductase [Clostridiaceae bacterium]
MDMDVIVCGAGPAGIAAALAADANGAKTMLIERAGMVGGMATEGMINVFCGDASSALYEEIFEKLVVRIGHRKVYDTEELKAFLLEKLAASGVHPLQHAAVFGAKLADGHIDGVQTLENGGVREHRAGIYIDCTGNGDLAAACGVPYTLGRETDGAMQPVTVYVRIGGIDTAAYRKHVESEGEALQKALTEAGRRGELAPEACALRLIPEKREGYINLNMTNALGIDGTSSEELTCAEWHCRMQIPGILSFIRRNVQGCGNAYVVQTGAYAGIRESRHFRAAYMLHEDDLAEGKIFEDWCVSNAQNAFNVHNMSGAGVDQTGKSCANRYTIPYRSLRAEGVSNLLLAGRNIGGTHMAHSSYRVMPICMAMGQAAGTAAAMAAKEQCAPGEINVAALQKKLTAQGVCAPSA